MKRTKQIARGTGKVILALFAVALMPILVWVALGAALNERLREKKLRRAPAPTDGEIVTTPGLTTHEPAVPKHCWEVLHCRPEQRETCPARARRDIPRWVAAGLGKGTEN